MEQLPPDVEKPGRRVETQLNIAQAAQKLFSADLSAVQALNPITGRFYGRAILTSTAALSGTSVQDRLKEIAEKAIEQGGDLYAERGSADKLGLGGVSTVGAIVLHTQREGKPVAVLVLGFSGEREFSPQDRDLLELIATQYAPILENVWLLGRYREVVKIGQEINQTLIEPKVLFEHLYKKVSTIINTQYCFILGVYHQENGTADYHAAYGGELLCIEGRPLTGVSAYVIKSKEPYIETSRSRNPRPPADLVPLLDDATPHPESYIFVPLIFRDEPLGILSIQRLEAEAFDNEDLQIMTLLGNQVALAMSDLRLFGYLEALNQTGRELTSQLTSEEMLSIVVKRIRDTTKADVVTLYPYVHDTDKPVVERFRKPRTSGELFDPDHQSDTVRDDDIAWLALHKDEPVWATDSAQLFKMLGGNPELREGFFEQREGIVSTAALALRIEGVEVGVLFISYRRRQRFDATQRTLILSLADYASIALRNSNTLLTLSRRRFEELEALREIERRIVTQLDDPGQVMQVVLAEAMKLIGADLCELHLYDEGRLGTTYSASKDDGTMLRPRRYDRGDAPPSRRGIVTHVATTLKPYVSGNTSIDPYYTGGPGGRSEAAFPLISDGELMGVLNLESDKRDAFDADDVRLLEVFAGHAVIALRKAEAYTRIKLESRRFRLLYEAGRELSKITDPEQLDAAYDIVVEGVGQFSDGEVVIRRYDPATESLVLVSVGRSRPTPPAESIPQGVGVNGQAARELKTIWVDDVVDLPVGVVNPEVDNPSVKALVVTPLVIESSYYGNLVLSHEAPHAFNADDVRLVEGLARQLAITINRIETLRARAEAERRAHEAMLMSQLGQTTMELTHRLGNDLGLVRMYAKNIVRAVEEQGVDGGTIRENLDKIVRDVSNVLDMSSGIKKAAVSFGGLNPVAERAVISAGELLEQARLSLPPLPANVAVSWKCDELAAKTQVSPGQVTDILRNLVVNAAEAMPEGGAVSVCSYASGQNLCVEVSDAGPGVPKALQPKLFKLFFSTKRSSGFGLWSARQYARTNGGDLTYEQREGRGATFLLRLPLASAREDAE